MPPETNTRRFLFGLTGSVVAAYYLFFTWKSVGLYFDRDDMMNLYLAWNKPILQVLKENIFFMSSAFRPLGALFYRSLYAVAGFNPMPFRLVCLLIGAGNIALFFWFAKLVSRSERIAALAILLFAFHPRLLEVWYRTAVVYDLLCFAFFYLAACLYIDSRRRGHHLGIGRSVAIVLLYICALNSKESAVALPAILLAWETIFEKFSWKNVRLVLLIGLMTVPYVIGKTHGPDSLTNNPAYRPEYTFQRFAHSWSVFLNYLFMQGNRISPAWGVTILAVLLAAAVVFRSRLLGFSWCVLFAATLPVVFLEYRGGFVLYLSYAGWTLYVATVLVKAQDAVTRARPQYRTALACCVFAIVAWRFGKVSLHDERVDPRAWLYEAPRLVRQMADQMRALHPALPSGARTLFLEDSFTTEEWTPFFIMKLLYRDAGLTVDRMKMMDRKPTDWSGYQYVFTCEKGAYRQLKP